MLRSLGCVEGIDGLNDLNGLLSFGTFDGSRDGFGTDFDEGFNDSLEKGALLGFTASK